MQEFCDLRIVQPLMHPERYAADAFIPAPQVVCLFGRHGNRIAQTVEKTIAAAAIRVTTVTARDNTASQVLDKMNDTLQKKTKSVLIVNRAEILSAVLGQSLIDFKEDWRGYTTKSVVVLIFSVPPSDLPVPVRLNFIGQRGDALYVPPPTYEWRQQFFKHIFTTFAAHVAATASASIKVNMTDDDYAFLAECSPNLTADEIQNWCEAQFLKLYSTKTTTTAEITLDLLKEHRHLYNIAGAQWQLLEYDGNAMEARFSMDAGEGALAVRDISAERAAAGQEEERQRQAKRARIIDGDGVEKEEQK